MYSPVDEERVRFVRSAQRLGLTLGEIREILELRDRGRTPCDYVRALIRSHAASVDRKIAELRALKEELVGLERRARGDTCEGGDPGGICHILQPSAR